MKQTIKTLMISAILLLVTQFSFAGTTEDLWKALKEANYPNALTAIAAGADVKSVDPSFGTPLYFASGWADANVVKALIDAKSDVNYIVSSNGFTPLANATAWGNVENTKLLLAAGADIKIKSKLGQPMLATAIASANLEVVKLLVNAGADPNEKYTIYASKDLTLMNALIGTYDGKGKLTYIQGVATALAKLNVTFPDRIKNAKESDFSPLEDMAKYLLEKGADPNQKVPGTWGTIIFQATEFGKTGIVKALLDAKVDIETKGNYVVQLGMYPVTLLQIAAIKGDNEMVEMLCKAGAKVNYVTVMVKKEVKSDMNYSSYTLTTTEKQTALSFAGEAKHPDTITLLKKYGGLGPKEIKK